MKDLLNDCPGDEERNLMRFEGTLKKILEILL